MYHKTSLYYVYFFDKCHIDASGGLHHWPPLNTIFEPVGAEGTPPPLNNLAESALVPWTLITFKEYIASSIKYVYTLG